MADKTYSRDPIEIHSKKKTYLAVIGAVVLLFALQVTAKMIFGRKAKASAVLVQDPNRALFKEEDVALKIQKMGSEARESFLAKMKKKKNIPEQGQRNDRLGSVGIVRHEEFKNESDFVPPETLGSGQVGLPLGTKMIAIMKDKIFSFNIENHVEAELVKDVYYLGKLRLPKGTKFFGTVSVLHSEDRVNIFFYRLLLPTGAERDVRAVAHALDGSAGIKGKAHKQWFNRFFTVTGKTALSALTLFTVPNRQDAFSLDDQLRLTAASNLSQEASRELDRVKVDKSITVEGYIPIQIVLLETL